MADAVFGDYSRYYDLFYGDKDYAGEASFVADTLREWGVGAGEVLEIGSGTGRHAAELARLGYRVHGIDLSDTMLARANSLRATLPPTHAKALEFGHGDARTYRAGRTFDAVISLFHVMSYQTSNVDLLAAFETAAAHLATGGLFMFDCWYGPAVLTTRPEHRERVLSDAVVEVTRVAEPVMLPNEDVCEVHYDVRIRRLDGSGEERLTEVHPMRYLFAPEVQLALQACGMSLEHVCEFMTGAPLDFGTWNGTFVARKR